MHPINLFDVRSNHTVSVIIKPFFNSDSLISREDSISIQIIRKIKFFDGPDLIIYFIEHSTLLKPYLVTWLSLSNLKKYKLN